MARIIFIQPDGQAQAVEAPDGFTVMEAAVRNGVDGIRAECGGACACATCHVYVDKDWRQSVGAAGEDEAAMLEFAPEPRAKSRLSCQIRISRALDGLVVHIPALQS